MTPGDIRKEPPVFNEALFKEADAKMYLKKQRRKTGNIVRNLSPAEREQ